MNSSLIISTVDPKGGKLQKTVTNINAQTDNSLFANFARSLTGLTKNTYKSTAKINRYEIKNVDALPQLEGISLVTETDDALVNVKSNTFSLETVGKPEGKDYYRAIAQVRFRSDIANKYGFVANGEHFLLTEAPQGSFGYATYDAKEIDTEDATDYAYYLVMIIPANTANCLGRFTFTLDTRSKIALRDFKPVSFTFTATA